MHGEISELIEDQKDDVNEKFAVRNNSVGFGPAVEGLCSRGSKALSLY